MSLHLQESWLKTWVDFDLEPDALAEMFSLLGLECIAHQEEAGFTKVVVGRVVSTEPHPAADRLKLCAVDIGEQEMLSIVCGDPTVEADMLVPVAQIGARLPGGKIKKSKIRGIPSQGMLCSAQDLGLEEVSDGLLRLDLDAPIGRPVSELLSKSAVFEFDLTPNRGDCFSVLGITRELAQALGQPLKRPEIKAQSVDTAETIAVQIDNTQACPNYVTRVMQGLNPGSTTPQWIVERLQTAKMRPVHPVVDILNYVMLELGQPMHAFDLSAVKAGIQVREAKQGESLKLLDEAKFECLGGELLICEAQTNQPVAVAGVMGGVDSGVQDGTVDILIESAFFKSEGLCETTQRHQLHSDASARFTRGVDFSLAETALERATALILETMGGQVGPICIQIDQQQMPQANQITLTQGYIDARLGTQIEMQKMLPKLNALGFAPVKKQDEWLFNVPAHRFDVQIPEDCLEEIARCYGYDQIPALIVDQISPAPASSMFQLNEARLADALQALGYQELVNFSFIDPTIESMLLGESKRPTIQNPMSGELSVMRQSLLQGLLRSAKDNLNRQRQHFALYEMGVCFEQDADTIIETPRLAMLLTGRRGEASWGNPSTEVDFFDLKGDFEAVFDRLGISGRVDFLQDASPHPVFHPGCAAQIKLHGKNAGYAGRLHPTVAQQLEIDQPLVLLEINLKSLSKLKRAQLKSVSKFPQVERDLTLIVDKSIKFADIAQVAKKAAGSDLHALKVFDLYTNETMDQENRHALSLSTVFQSAEETLTETAMHRSMTDVVAALRKQFEVEIKGYE